MRLIQSLIDKYYRHPKSKALEIKRYGGKYAYQQMLLAHDEMKVAAFKLSPITTNPESEHAIFFLTGKKYIHQTIFCVKSLAVHSSLGYQIVLLDDGSFDDDLIMKVKKIIPSVIIITAKEIEENLNKYLPVKDFPKLRAKRLVYPHLKKLTDLHTLQGFGDYKVILDSDMLFWKNPSAFNDHMIHHNLMCMVDINEAYGYDRSLMGELTKTQIPANINVGVVGFNSSTIDFSELEEWIIKLEAASGASYYLEQALTAMLLSRCDFQFLPKRDYVVKPEQISTHKWVDVLHHYVDVSKKIYFCYSWQKFI